MAGGIFTQARHVIAVDGVSLNVPSGSVLGVVGESGCGKSTLARLILGLMTPTSGDTLVHGQSLFALDRKARARLIQPVFQDPFSSLNPRQTIQEIVSLPLVAQGTYKREEITKLTADILDRVGISQTWPAVCRRNSPAASASGWRSRARW